MAVLSKEELYSAIEGKFKEDDSDETIKLIEDLHDTIESYDSNDWKTKYEENDKEWRKRYKERFFSGEKDDKVAEVEEEEEKEPMTYDDLFKKEDK